MQLVVRLWLVAFSTLAVAQPRPLVFEGKEIITVSDVAYTGFGGVLAIDGPPEGAQVPVHPAEPQLTSPIGPDGVDTGMLGEIAVRLFGKK